MVLMNEHVAAAGHGMCRSVTLPWVNCWPEAYEPSALTTGTSSLSLCLSLSLSAPVSLAYSTQRT